MPIESLIKPQEVVNGGIFRSSPTNTRFDSTLLAPHVKSAERIYIRQILCSDLYDAMIAAQNPLVSNYNPAVGPTVEKFPNNPNFESLWREILLELESLAVYHQSLPFIVYQTGSNGLFLNDSQFAETAGNKGLVFLLDKTKQSIISLQEELGDYLCNNKNQFNPDLAFQKKCVECNDCTCCNDPCECLGLDNKMKSSGPKTQAGILFYPTRRHPNKYYGKNY